MSAGSFKYILESLFGFPRRRSREECTIEGAEMLEGVVGEGGEGGGNREGGEKGNWEKFSEIARIGRGKQVDKRYKQTKHRHRRNVTSHHSFDNSK